MNSDRPYSIPEQACFALECCLEPTPQVEQPVGSCICPRKFYEGIVPDDPPGFGDIIYVSIGCPVHWTPSVYLSESAVARVSRELEAWGAPIQEAPSESTSTTEPTK